MFGLFLSGLGSAAAAAGLPSLASGLNTLGSIGGAKMPFGLSASATTPGTAANGGWSTSVTPTLDPLRAGVEAVMPQQGGQGDRQRASPIPMLPALPAASAQPGGPVDISQLAAILNGRSRLGA